MFALLLVPILASASAQLPTGGEPISISASATEVDVSTEDPITLTLTVQRSSPSGGLPVDDILGILDEGDVTVGVAGVPEGWVVTIQPDGFTLTPGQSRDVEVTIALTPGAAGDDADLVFTAVLETADPTGLLAPGGEASTTVTATRDDSPTRQLLEAIGPGIWAILGALVVAIVVAIFLALDRRTRVVELTANASEVQVRPGKTATLPFWIENRGKETDRFALSANTGDAGWKAALAVTAVTLEPGQKEELHVAVTPNQQAPVGSRAVVRIVAVPDHSPSRIAVLAVSALVEA